MRPTKLSVAIGLVWLFHISGIVGICLGFGDWFLPKTPVNLLLSFGLLLWIGKLTTLRKIWFIYLFFSAGMLIEWVGVTYGFPFGNYVYGNNLGAKLDGVPYLIGINWAMLIVISASIAARITPSLWLRVLLGASLMVFLDFFIEANAARFDFWYWAGNEIPLSNYFAWFVLAFGLNWVYQRYMERLDFSFSINLYLAQLVFFASFYFYAEI